MSKVELIATTAMGIESIAASEIRSLGYEPITENGRVSWTADISAICRANIWLRSSDRVLIKMGEFKCTSFDELFENTKKLPWHEWITKNMNFNISGRSHQSQLSSVPAVQSVAEKAIIENLKEHYKIEWFPKNGARINIEAALLKDTATLTIDTSGLGLHKRGYRKLAGPAPIKETLAAALITLSHWHPDRPFMDPLCGTGTIPLEAALMGLNIAPGLNRKFDAEFFTEIPHELWEQAREEAHDLADYDKPLQIMGSDINEESLELAKAGAKNLGLSKIVKFETKYLSHVKTDLEYGTIITNPPYGERMGDEKAVLRLYKEMGDLSRALPTWSFNTITSHAAFQNAFGRKADKNRKLYNGNIQCYYYQYFGPKRPRRAEDSQTKKADET